MPASITKCLSNINKVVIFGTNDFAELADFYLKTDWKSGSCEVVAFTVNKEYLKEDTFKGKPVVPFEEITKLFPPTQNLFFAPLANNILRGKIYSQAKNKGYKFISYISSKATVFGNHIGENCFILEDNTIQPFVEIGNNVILWSGNHCGHHSKISDHCFLSSHVVLSGHCQIEPYCWFGVNSTIRDNLKIAEGTMLAMGAVLTKNTDPWSLYMGIPAKKIEGKDTHELL